MKKELTEEHLFAYMPHQPLKGVHREGHICIIDIGMVHRFGTKLANYRMMLRPLSQLTETIEHGGQRFVPSQRIDDMGYRVHPLTYDAIGVLALPYWVVQLLLSWQVDIFSLIESGLAEPIPSIKQP